MMKDTRNPQNRTTLPYQEIDTPQFFHDLLQQQEVIEHYAFQSIDFSLEENASRKKYKDCLFMGCQIPTNVHPCIDENSCLIFPKISLPFNAFQNCLYNAESLYEGYELGQPTSHGNTFDSKVYRHYLENGIHANDIKETLARALHDHAMSDAMYDLLSTYNEKHVVGIMGGHGLLRTDPIFHKIVYISKALTEQHFLMVSGGGPGAMEATHLGAWMAGRSAMEVEQALNLLCQAPDFKDPLWLDTALQVMKKYPQHDYQSLGVPTWLYGHEPATPFATHIAKYFENAIREDGILTIAMGGIIYTPGSAGTVQEIFQDAVQNHYLSFGYASPMVFLGKDYWTKELPIYSLLTQMMEKGRYKNLLLTLSDDMEEIITPIKQFSQS